MDELMIAQIRCLLGALAGRLTDTTRDYPIQDRRADAVTLFNIMARLK